MSEQNTTPRRSNVGLGASIERLNRSLEAHQTERERVAVLLNACEVDARIEEVGLLIVRRMAAEHLIERVQTELEAMRAAADAPLTTKEIASAQSADAERRRLERKGAISQRLAQLEQIIVGIETEAARSGSQQFRRTTLIESRKEQLRLKGEQHRLTVAGHLSLREQVACEVEFVSTVLAALKAQWRGGLTRPYLLSERIEFTESRLVEVQTELAALSEQPGDAAA